MERLKPQASLDIKILLYNKSIPLGYGIYNTDTEWRVGRVMKDDQKVKKRYSVDVENQLSLRVGRPFPRVLKDEADEDTSVQTFTGPSGLPGSSWKFP